MHDALHVGLLKASAQMFMMRAHIALAFISGGQSDLLRDLPQGDCRFHNI